MKKLLLTKVLTYTGNRNIYSNTERYVLRKALRRCNPFIAEDSVELVK